MKGVLTFHYFKRLRVASLNPNLRRHKSTSPTDSCGIPIHPTWSVNELLSSYPSPKLSNKTIQKLYELSALIQPEEGTLEYENMKQDLEEMIRLVEAVRLVDTAEVQVRGRNEKQDADREQAIPQIEENGQALLQHTSQTQNGFYVVHSERRR